MSNLKLFYNTDGYRGVWDTNTVYSLGDVVKGSNNTAYRCKVTSSTGAATNPISNSTNWGTFVPASLYSGLSATQANRLSTAATFGINAGSTWQYNGAAWVLEKTANAVTLVKAYNNCNCNCNCNCTGTDCNCASNCNCLCSQIQFVSGPQCASYSNGVKINDCDCPVYWWGNCDCNCSAVDCNCASNCNCNCTPI